jgi:hypothetical protein
MSAFNAHCKTTESGFIQHLIILPNYIWRKEKASVAKQKGIIDYTIMELLQHETNIVRL